MTNRFRHTGLIAIITLILTCASPLHVVLDHAALAHHISAHHLSNAHEVVLATEPHGHAHQSDADHQHPHPEPSAHATPHTVSDIDHTNHCHISEHHRHDHHGHHDPHHDAELQLTTLRIDSGKNFVSSCALAPVVRIFHYESEAHQFDFNLPVTFRVATSVSLRGPPVA